MTSKKNKIHVIKKDNEWITKKSHSERTLSRSSTKVEAIGRAVSQAKRDGNTEVIVHAING